MALRAGISSLCLCGEYLAALERPPLNWNLARINDVLFGGLSRQVFEAFATMIKTLLVNSERAFDKVAEIERKHQAPREAAD